MLLYPIGTTAACSVACSVLKQRGVSFTDHPCPEITHLLLDVPSFSSDNKLRCGGQLEPVLSMIPPSVHVLGGNLNIPCLDGYIKTDLLQDTYYLARNAEITSDCALRLAGTKLTRTFSDTNALVIGWGRIGKCLSRKLFLAGCRVTIAARKIEDRAMIRALGYDAVSIEEMPLCIGMYNLIFNTVPHSLPHLNVPEDTLVYELASVPGLSADSVIIARGLPGTLAPVTSGKLIAECIIKLCLEERR